MTPERQPDSPEPHQRPDERARRLTKWTLLAAWGVLAAWSACLWVLAGEAFGSSWAQTVETASGELATVAAALLVSNVLVRAGFWLARFLGRAGGSPAPAAAEGWLNRRYVRALGAALTACAIGGTASTLGVYLAGAALRELATMFLYPSWMWSAARMVAKVALMLPLGASAGVLVLLAGLLRRYGPSDPYRYITRELLAGTGWGLAAAAAMWWAGANLLGVSMACAAALLALGVVTTFRAGVGGRPVRLTGPARTQRGRVRQRWANLLSWAALAAAPTAQVRALRDAGECSWAAGWLWVGATLGMMALVSRRVERRVVAGGALEARAATVGAAILVSMQLALLALAAGGGSGRWLAIALAAAGQWPLATLAGTVLSRRRRLFGQAAYSARCWLADAALGTAVGAEGTLLVLSLPLGPLWLALAAVAGVVGVALAGARPAAEGSSTRRGSVQSRRFQWLALSAAAVAAMGLTWTGLAHVAAAPLGSSVAVGESLTARQWPSGPPSVLGGSPTGLSPELTDAAVQVIGSRPGRWWIVAAGESDMVGRLGEGCRKTLYFPDAAVGRLPAWRGSGGVGDFQRYLSVETQALDGVYLGGLPADHADAWCLYSAEALHRCLSHLTPGGALLVRVSARADALDRALAVAETLRLVAGDAAALVHVRRGEVEMLLIARRPAGADQALPAVEAAGGGIVATSLAELSAFGGGVLSIRRPGAQSRAAATPHAMVRSLRGGDR